VTGHDVERIIADLAEIASRTDTSLLLVGAQARDLCVGRAGPGRLTRDVDFAVRFDDWSAVDAFFRACTDDFRDVDQDELLMYHRATGLKVDVVPCGGIESPSGTLALRGSQRRLNTTGLLECLALGTPLLASSRVVLPPPAGFVLLKLLAYRDRQEPRDLADLGHVVHRYPYDVKALWEDAAFVSMLSSAKLDYDDFRVWCVGRDLSRRFEPATVTCFAAALDAMLADTPHVRSRVDDGHPRPPDTENRLERADRLLNVLRMSVNPTAG